MHVYINAAMHFCTPMLSCMYIYILIYIYIYMRKKRIAAYTLICYCQINEDNWIFYDNSQCHTSMKRGNMDK